MRTFTLPPLSLSLLLLLSWPPLPARAQAAMTLGAPTEFAADAMPLEDDALRERVAGKVFAVKPADGSTWRLEYKANGYMFIDISTGFRDDGTWKVADGKLCSALKRIPPGCGEVRSKGDTLFLKRTNGEIVALTIK